MCENLKEELFLRQLNPKHKSICRISFCNERPSLSFHLYLSCTLFPFIEPKRFCVSVDKVFGFRQSTAFIKMLLVSKRCNPNVFRVCMLYRFIEAMIGCEKRKSKPKNQNTKNLKANIKLKLTEQNGGTLVLQFGINKTGIIFKKGRNGCVKW